MDDSLDDFFAKKDKASKKKGKKSKIVLSDLLPASTPTPPNEPSDGAENLPESFSEIKLDSSRTDSQSGKEKKKQKKKKDKDGLDANSRKEEDEWNEVTDEVDYSGLRIATKNIAKENAEEAGDSSRQEPEYDEDGQIIDRSNDSRTVWKINTPEPKPAPVEQEKTTPAPLIAEMPNVSGGRYIPPGQRGNASKDLAPVSIKKPGRKKQAPNVNSQEDFPTLGSAPPPVDYDVSNFEKVRGGGSSQHTPSQTGPSRLETSNMYSALERR